MDCNHENVEITPPCCRSVGSSGYIECGCGGHYSVWCPDCENDQLTELQIEDLLAGVYEEPEYAYYD